MDVLVPLVIVFLRDGVGEGQISEVKELEVAEIQRCFKEAGLTEVKLTFIIVSKRINTKFFKGPENPLSGKILLVSSSLLLLLSDHSQERSWTLSSPCRRDTISSS